MNEKNATFRGRLQAVALACAGILAMGCPPKTETDPGPVAPLQTNTNGDDDDGGPATSRAYPSPPPPSAPKPVNFPNVKSFVASNGIRTFVVENHEVPIVSAELVIRAGTMDGNYQAALTAAMLGEGTNTRTKAKIDEAIEFVGGTLTAGAGVHSTYVHSRTLSKDLKLALVLMNDQVTNASFPPDALEKLKGSARAALNYNRSQPSFLADSLLRNVMYPSGHPYGQSLPSTSEIDGLSVDTVRKFHKTFYRPNNTFLILSGDVTIEEARPIVERTFARWPKVDTRKLPPNPLNGFTDYALPKELVVHVIDRPGTPQTEVRIGNLAVARNHGDWVRLKVTLGILGDDASGRLFMDLREERGLTYGIRSYVLPGQAPGAFVIETNTRNENVGELLAAVFEHIQRIREEDPAQAEFDAVVRKMVGQFPLQVETANDIVDRVRDTLEYGLSRDYWRRYRDELRKVQVADIKKTARKYIHAVPHVVLVGDAANVRQQVSAVLPSATIVEYDDNLRRK